MAPSSVIKKAPVVKAPDYSKQIKDLNNSVNDLICRLEKLEEIKNTPVEEKKILHKVEQFNGEVVSEIEEGNSMKMALSDKIQSMRNAIMILPPNMTDSNGKHIRENIQAICGFMVNQEMLDAAYEGITIEP